MPVEIILTSDIHLDRYFNFPSIDHVFQRKEDINRNFHTIVQAALNEKPDLFLISGDVFDQQRPSNYARVFLTKEIRALNDAGIKVFLIGGNHEISRQDKFLPLAIDALESAGIATVFSRSDKIQSMSFKVDGSKVCISGKSYNGQNEGANPLKGEKICLEGDVNILMLHGSLAGLGVMPNYPDMANSNPFSPGDISRGLDLLALGHFHKQFDRNHNATLICNPGSIERLRWDEIDDIKGYYWIELGGSEPILEFRKLPMRPMEVHELVVDTENMSPFLFQIVESLKPIADPLKMLKLFLKGSIPRKRFSEVRLDSIYHETRSMFFNLELDVTNFLPEGMTPFSTTEFEEPLSAFTRHMDKLMSAETSQETKDLLIEAKELGRKYLIEASSSS